MKKLLILCVACLSVLASAMGQPAKKPTLMVVPGDVWCNENGYMTEYDNQGTTVLIPDYKRALQTDPQLLLVISKINTLMADRGFPLKNLESVLRSVEQQQAENNLIMGKTSGAFLAESPLDRIRNVAKADIILQLTWQTHQNGPKTYISFNLQGLDAYTNKQIAGEQGNGEPSLTADVPVLLEEAVLAHMDNFTARLQSYFDDLFANGREVVVSVRVLDNGSGLDLDKDYDGYALSEIIDEWMYNNTVEHRFSKLGGSENYLSYEQVRIPLLNSRGMPMDTEAFVRDLRRFLMGEPYRIDSRVLTQGLGSAMLLLGDK